MAKAGHRSGETQVKRAEDRRRVMELRKAGTPFETIARQLGYANKSTAYRAYRTALREHTKEPTEELIELELMRLDSLQRACWPAAMAGGLGAIDRALKVSESRRRLLGLDAPQRVDIGDGGADLDAAVTAVMSALPYVDAEVLDDDGMPRAPE